MLKALRRLAAICLCVMLSLGLMAPASVNAAGINPDDLAVIRRQAAAFEATKSRLPDLARLVSEEDWIFTRNLLHGPMQEVGREMLYINQRLLPQDRAEAKKLATSLKDAMADLDEAARLQDDAKLQKSYEDVVSGFANYSEVIPEQALS